jgi:glucokinase
MRRAIGMDLGGSNLRAAAFERDVMVAQHREPVGEPRDPEAIVERVARVVEQLAGDAPTASAGIGLAAMLRDRKGTVARSPHLRWVDVPFGELLARRLGPRFSLAVYNDANAIVWGETVAGAARGCRDVLGVYVGTGIGGGVVCGGQLVEGATNCAGEIGHAKVRWDEAAAPCQCGQRGCIEAYIGGSYLQRRILRELGARGARSSALHHAGGLENVTVAHVDMAAADGDDWALSLWGELAPLLGVALGNAVAVLNPERLVLGGGVLSRCPTLYELVVTAVELATPTPCAERLTVVPAELGDDAGVVGSARLAASGVSLIDL